MPTDDDRPRWAKAAADRRENGGLGLPAGWNPSRRVRLLLVGLGIVVIVLNKVLDFGTPPDAVFGVIGFVALCFLSPHRGPADTSRGSGTYI